MSYLWIFLGGGLGSMARYFCAGYVASKCGGSFPWGTLLVNVLGSFLIGVLAALASSEGRWSVPPAGREFLMIGVCGGYTTFSSFSLETLNLARDGDWLLATSYVAGSVFLCLAGVWLGYLLVASIASSKGG